MSHVRGTATGQGDIAARERETAAWVARAAAGDRAAWDALVDRFGGVVWAIARSGGLRASDAADVSQTVWLRFVEHMDRIEQPGRVGAWLATTAKRECIRLRSRGDRQVPVGDAWVFDTAPDWPDTIDRKLLDHERDQLLREAVAALPERARALLALLTADPSLSYAEVSSILDIPIGSIGPTRARVLARLRRNAERLGISVADVVPRA